MKFERPDFFEKVRIRFVRPVSGSVVVADVGALKDAREVEKDRTAGAVEEGVVEEEERAMSLVARAKCDMLREL